MLNFDNKVIVITGAARGIGAEYARLFASRNAKLFLNDNSQENGVFVIENFVKELKSQFQTEIAFDIESVENGHKIIENAIKRFQKIDVLINNAGVLVDRGMTKITIPEFDQIIRVHLKGTFRCVLAAWQYFRKQKFGRIINTSSSSGLFGNFGQTNYSAAKAGIHGLTLALAKEGANYNIKVNTIAPIARTRMTEGLIPDDLIVAVPAKAIAPLVALLSHEDCPESGQIYEVGGGWIAKLRWQRAEGGNFPLDLTPEILKKNWETVINFDRNCDYPTSGSDSIEKMFSNFEKQSTKELEEKNSQVLSESSSSSSSEQIYKLMKAYVEAGHAKKAVKKCNAVFQFDIIDSKSGKLANQFWVSVKEEKQTADKGSAKDVDAIFSISENDFFDVCMGKLNPQIAFTKRKMKIQGNFKKASSFTPDLFPQPTKENIEKYLGLKPKL